MDFWNTLFSWNTIYIVTAVLCFYYFVRYRVTVLKFVGEVRVELEKCSWPWDPNQTGFKKYKELIESTVVVIISVVLLAGFVTSWSASSPVRPCSNNLCPKSPKLPPKPTRHRHPNCRRSGMPCTSFPARKRR
jgi:preprotein translocase subunit SecE